jgi:hypothetical protein
VTRPIPLRHGARTPQARVLERKHNAVIQSLASEKTMRPLMEDYHAGELSGHLYACTVTVFAAMSSARNTYRLAKLVRPTGQSSVEMQRMANELEAAAECLRKAAKLAFPAPEMLQAAE